ncbi:MAG: T9SS type A sorting domain-containing protein [Cryomorphaceae bacterium]
MKKIYALVITALLSGSVFAQGEWIVPQENVGLITKITATWCNPCGTWGWEAMEGVLETYGEDHIVVSLYAPSSSKLYNTAAQELADEIGYSGTPNFAGNGLDKGTSVAEATAIADTFASAPTLAVPAYAIEWVNADTIVIEVKTRFFENIDGSFFLDVFMVEDHVMEEQNGHTGDVPHHMVVRKGFMPLKDSTNLILSGSAASGDEISKKYFIEVDSEWDWDELMIVSTLWMENPEDPADLLYVNGQKTWQEGELTIGYGTDAPIYYPPHTWAIGVEEVEELAFEIYPNPAKNNLTIKLSDVADVEVVFTDLLGKEVLHTQFTSRDLINIDVTEMPAGVYMVQLKTERGDLFDRVVVK